ncbi:uncharacterized protein [Choristoneura fumiferana]|uniref:uncharacterized protein n=1 Tax=Choristoneura fumiferana TaxID=7141 RepID=UPI003D15D405
MASAATCLRLCAVFCVLLVIEANIEKTPQQNDVKEELDKVIEDEITSKLATDLLQSIERKFQVDLEKSVNMVLVKIKILLQNGTSHIQDRLHELQAQLEAIRNSTGTELETCLKAQQNVTTALAEKTLHQMVVCGYALIGHDPAQAVSAVVAMKDMIKTRLKPIYEQKKDVYGLLKLCGHDHDTLKKVIKCVISKSPLIKSAMMDVTGKLIDGVVELTKLMAHGAMHEACLIEVIKSVEDEAFDLVRNVRDCAFGNKTLDAEARNFIKENNATVLDITPIFHPIDGNKKEVVEMKDLLRRMLNDDNGKDLDKRFKKKLKKLQKDLTSVDKNVISNDVKTVDK